MKAAQIRVGGIYLMKVSGVVQRVRVDQIRVVEGTRTSTYSGIRRTRSVNLYHCTNLATGRTCTARSASKFRGEAKSNPVTEKPRDGEPGPRSLSNLFRL